MSRPSEAILECLAHGIYDLNKGDPSNLATAREVETQMLVEHGIVHLHGTWVSKEEAVDGFTADSYVMKNGLGQWHTLGGKPVASGTVIYFTDDLQHPLLTVP